MKSKWLTEAQKRSIMAKIDADYYDDDCWLWTGEMLRRETANRIHYYPIFYVGDTSVSVARTIYEIARDVELPDDEVVRRTCGKPHCVRPTHLYALSRAEAGREIMDEYPMKGEQHPQARLTEEDVLAIRRLAPVTPYKILAEEYDVSKKHISHIVNRRRWTHI